MKHAVVVLLVSILLLGGTSLNASGFLGLFGGSHKWKEEVKLSDGRIVVIQRETVMERGGDEWASNRSGTKPKEKRISFEDPRNPGKTIEWRSSKMSPSTYPETPLIFDIEPVGPVVYTIVATSGSTEMYSKYVFRNGSWSEEALPEVFEKRITNLQLKTGEGFVNLETKRKNNSDSGYRINILEVGPNRTVSMNRRR